VQHPLNFGILLAGILAVLGVTDAHAQHRLTASGFTSYANTAAHSAGEDGATNVSFVLPATVTLTNLPHVSGGAFAFFGTNELSAKVTGPHYPCDLFEPPAECAGDAISSFASAWVDWLTITGATSCSCVSFTFVSGGSAINISGGYGEVWINDESPQGDFSEVPVFIVSNGSDVRQSGAIRFTNGVPIKIKSELAGGGKLGYDIGVAPYVYQNISIYNRLIRIALPDGAVLTSASGHAYPTNYIPANIDIFLDSESIQLGWNASPLYYDDLETTSDLSSPFSWVPISGTSTSGGARFTLRIPRDEPARFFRRVCR
jgi:hypothetical protein